jgi:hypothetical protein
MAREISHQRWTSTLEFLVEAYNRRAHSQTGVAP